MHHTNNNNFSNTLALAFTSWPNISIIEDQLVVAPDDLDFRVRDFAHRITTQGKYEYIKSYGLREVLEVVNDDFIASLSGSSQPQRGPPSGAREPQPHWGSADDMLRRWSVAPPSRGGSTLSANDEANEELAIYLQRGHTGTRIDHAREIALEGREYYDKKGGSRAPSEINFMSYGRAMGRPHGASLSRSRRFNASEGFGDGGAGTGGDGAGLEMARMENRISGTRFKRIVDAATSRLCHSTCNDSPTME